MRYIDDGRRPRVFLSYAWCDERRAEKFVTDLERHGLEMFIDSRDIQPGENTVIAIDRAIRDSDYFVLLWSAAARDREFIAREWSAAFVQEVRRRRVFLFVVRLDNTDPPVLLAPDRYLDAFVDWDAAVVQLVEAWRRDRAIGVPVLPCPQPSGEDPGGHQIVRLYVYNRAFKVAHLLAAPVACTTCELRDRVHRELALPDSVSAHNGLVGLRFSYRFALNGNPMPEHRTLAELGIANYASINLEVWQKPFGPDGPASPVVYRAGEPSGLPAPMVEMLIREVFHHLLPPP